MAIYQWGGRNGRRGAIEITRVRRLTNQALAGWRSWPISARSRRRYLNMARLSQGLVEYHNVWSAVVCLVPGGGGGFGGGGGEAPVTRALTTIPAIGLPPRRATSPRAGLSTPRRRTHDFADLSLLLVILPGGATRHRFRRSSLSAPHPPIIPCLKRAPVILRQFTSI